MDRGSMGLKRAVALTLVMMLFASMALAEGIYTGEEGVEEITDMLSDWFDEDSSTASSGQSAALTSVADVERIYGFTLEGVSYTFPCMMDNFLNNGWSYAGWAADPGASLDAMTYSSAILTNADGKRLTVEIMNPTQAAVAVENAQLMSVTVKADDAPPAFATADGLSLGASYSDAIHIYGDGYVEYGMSDGGNTCKYSFYQILNDSPSYIGEPLTQQSGEDELSVISDADGVITSIYMKHAKF